MGNRLEKNVGLAKAVIASTTPVGAFLVSLWNDSASKFQQERKDELNKEIEEFKQKLENIISQEKLKDKHFYEYIQSAMEKMIQERTKEKRIAYRCCILNCASTKMSDYDYDIAEMILKKIDAITRTELIVLYLIKDQVYINPAKEDEIKTFVENICNKVGVNKEQLRSLVKHLESENLVESLSEIIGMISYETPFFQPSLVTNTVHKYITDLGEQLISYIVTPDTKYENNLLS